MLGMITRTGRPTVRGAAPLVTGGMLAGGACVGVGARGGVAVGGTTAGFAGGGGAAGVIGGGNTPAATPTVGVGSTGNAGATGAALVGGPAHQNWDRATLLAANPTTKRVAVHVRR